VLDAFSRRIVGWSMATTLHMQVVLDALNMALWQRRPSAVIHHSDHGSQYTSIEFGKRCREAGVRPSMGSVGDAYDNALAESFFATLECELLDRRSFKTQVEARMAIFEFIEGFYNPRRRHSSIGYLSPITFGDAPGGSRTRPACAASAARPAEWHSPEERPAPPSWWPRQSRAPGSAYGVTANLLSLAGGNLAFSYRSLQRSIIALNLIRIGQRKFTHSCQRWHYCVEAHESAARTSGINQSRR